MNNWRYKYGFKLGSFEHRTREIGYVFLLSTTVLLYLRIHDTVLILCGLALSFETISYVAHRLEKFVMNPIRHNRR